MNAGPMVKLCSARWHVPQVLPLPLKVSLKKMDFSLGNERF